MIEAFIELLKDESAQKILWRVIYIAGIGIGLRVGIRFLMFSFKVPKKQVYEHGRKIVVPSQLIVSLHNFYENRFELVPKEIYINGVKIDAITLEYLRIEQVISQGLMYGFGSIALYYCSMIVFRVLENKYKVSIISLGEAK